MHLRAEELVDLAEGTRAEASAPHLASCDRCRRQLAELRALMSSIVNDDLRTVPEPSPMFWDRFQDRVGEAVAAGGPPSRWAVLTAQASWWRRPDVLLPVGALAMALMIALGIDSRLSTRPVVYAPGLSLSRPQDSGALATSPRVDLLSDGLVDDDPSLALVASLTATLDASEAGEAGLTAHDSAEHAVTHLSAPELLELQRLLQAEIAKAGA